MVRLIAALIVFLICWIGGAQFAVLMIGKDNNLTILGGVLGMGIGIHLFLTILNPKRDHS